MISIKIDLAKQLLTTTDQTTRQPIKHYLISTAKNGPGEVLGSEKTPRGLHKIRAKIGANCLENTVFVKRRPTGEIFSEALQRDFPNRDWILTRILWLSGCEREKNRLGQVDTQRRYIYIHGTPDSTSVGIPGSRGCVRMRNQDIIELFDWVTLGTPVLIVE